MHKVINHEQLMYATVLERKLWSIEQLAPAFKAQRSFCLLIKCKLQKVRRTSQRRQMLENYAPDKHNNDVNIEALI